jgi:hypothetical protein
MPDNPARWDDLKAMGFETPKELTKGNHPSLPNGQMPKFIATFPQTDKAMSPAVRALETIIMEGKLRHGGIRRSLCASLM